jgi:hypothetical protein
MSMSDVQIPTSNANLIDFRYYAKTSASPIYSAAVALHPEMKFRYFENNWESHPDRVIEAKRFTTDLWKEKYKGGGSRLV